LVAARFADPIVSLPPYQFARDTCRMARMIGLSVPEPVIILVDEKTILEQLITFTLAGRAVAARPGLQFGSALVTGEVLDWMPGTMLGRVRNLREFAGLLAFDKWTGNADGRQVVFHKEMRERKYAASVEYADVLGIPLMFLLPARKVHSHTSFCFVMAIAPTRI
jgi:hypothetical protein